ncbi:hypothetical protein BDN72DRAFT_822095 [Pluteus cervinus]|uniref:Uncharacterized protein n=1 Tax=Pluteus cervinus TaxID=181527 RepID=A0ACD3APY5_9AGAR|nr:hypothetical protein BDN72DRAFT_822095 [Pluteus cervinus]
MCRVWKEEIDKLLIFAGLFSAAVTAFAVESYQWLESPGDINTELLMQLILLQSNSTLPSQLVPSLQPSASAIRINIFWFMSLTLSLGSVLVGILCLQWVREYQRPVSTASFKEKLTYRQIRHDGLISWGVPQIVSLIPVLLQISLILFFIGIFDLLWARNHLVALVILVPTALVTSFLAISTILPALQIAIVRFAGDSIIALKQCPYKSPQSWLICRLVFAFIDVDWSDPMMLNLVKTTQRTWFTLDHFWDDDRKVWDNPEKGHPKLARAIEWMQVNLPHHSEVTYNLYQCLTDIDDKTTDAIMLWFTEHLGSTPHLNAQATDNALPNSEVVSALFLAKFHNYTVGAMEHWIRAANSSPKLFPSIPMQEIKKLPEEHRNEFFRQLVLCGLSFIKRKEVKHGDVLKALEMLVIMSETGPITSPSTNHLIQHTIAAVTQWFVDPNTDPSTEDDVSKTKDMTSWMNLCAFRWFSNTDVKITKALILELVYKVGKKGDEIRQRAVEKGTYPGGQFQLQDKLQIIFHVSSWNILFSTPEPRLWWKANLVNFNPLDTHRLAMSDDTQTGTTLTLAAPPGSARSQP